MVTVPPGFRFHKGLDGLLVGVTVVFLVKVTMVLSSMVNWWLVPEWTYQPVRVQVSTLTDVLTSTASAVANLVRVEASGGGSSVVPALIGEAALVVLKITAAPLVLVGALSANPYEQAAIVLGFWIGVLVPLRWWVLRPAYFWWQDLEVR